MTATTEMRFEATPRAGAVSAVLERPAGARCLLVLAHGAGAGMRHPFLEALAAALAERDVATFRYQFSYAERGERRPDPQPLLLETVRRAIEEARAAAADLPLLAGGKSMGGRMTSLAAEGGIAGLRGLVFFGFPLHAAGSPGTARAAHLERVALPMLFLQGTRDALAQLDLLRPVVERLGARATLAVVDQADHSFRVPKRSGRSDGDVLAELAETVSRWAARLD